MTTTTGSGIGGHGGGRLAGERQREQEGHAALGQILRPDASAVRLHDALRDRETEPGAASAGQPAIELLEYLVLVAARQPGPAVSDLDRHRLVGRGGEDADRARGRRVDRKSVV